jgi:ATP-dependent Lhr-like helicase
MYSYSPITDNVLTVAESAAKDAIKKAENFLKPNPGQLKRISKRHKLPENERQLHTLLMIEGDLIAGELPVPLEWLEVLAEQERCLYIEPGLWIAAEHREIYQTALVDCEEEARQNMVRRALRYRGAMDIAPLAERYFWSEETAHAVLETLREQGSVIMEAGLYYHAELYERARHATITERRQVQTVPAFHYAALMAGRLRTFAPSGEQLKQSIEKLAGRPFPASQWEAHLLPARVNGYRPELLDQLLSCGEVFWRLGNEGLSFHAYADVDFDADISEYLDKVELDPDEQMVIQILRKRGASFISAWPTEEWQMQKPLQEVLFSLMEKGLIHADSFTPVRMWLEREKSGKFTVRQRVAARVATSTSGRWDIQRPLKPKSIEERLNHAFEKTDLLCRETASILLGIPWATALGALRTWEYTGRARRGYFVEGLSGAQYIREDAYVSIIQGLEHPTDKVIWLVASDPNQAWGKALPHGPDRQFTNVHSTVVALKKGIPVAVFERQGHTLRVFNESVRTDALTAFAEAFRKRTIFPALNRVTVKQYPPTAAQALADAGFRRAMLDYVLYR